MLYAFLPGVGPQEFIIIAVLGILLFGKRLPEVGKSLGKGLAEFKRGMSGIEDEFRSIGRTASSTRPPSYASSSSTTSAASNSPPSVTNDLAPDPTVPKFEPPTAAPSPAPAEAAVEPQPYQD